MKSSGEGMTGNTTHFVVGLPEVMFNGDWFPSKAIGDDFDRHAGV